MKGQTRQLVVCHQVLFYRQRNYSRNIGYLKWGYYNPITIESISDYGRILSEFGAYDEAEAILRRSLKLRSQVYGPESRRRYLDNGTLAICLRKKGNYSASELITNETLQAKKENGMTTKSESIQLGHLMMAKGDLPRAEAIFRNLVKEYKSNLPHFHTLNLANLLMKKGDYEEAEALYRLKLEKREQRFGVGSFGTADPIDKLGLLFTIKGDHQQSKAMFDQVLKIRERILGPAHADTITSALAYSSTLLVMGQANSAIVNLHKLLQTARKLSSESMTKELASILTALGTIYVATEKYKEGLLYLSESAEMHRLLINEGLLALKQSLIDTLNVLLKVYEKMGDKDQIIAILDEVRILQIQPATTNYDYSSIQNNGLPYL